MREREREHSTEPRSLKSQFCDLILERMCHHFSLFLLVTQTDLGSVKVGTTEECKDQEVGPSWTLANTELVCKTCSVAES